MVVEHVDFLSVHSTDLARSKRFFVETLGLPLDVDRGDRGFEVSLGQLCLSVWNPTAAGMELGPSPAHVAIHVEDVAAARGELEAAGVAFAGETFDTGVCHMAFFNDPDGNAFMLITGTYPVAEVADLTPPPVAEALRGLSRAEARELYEALPLPSTADEHWRFTDLRGFDPASFTAAPAAGASSGEAMLDLEVAGRVHVTESGIEIVSAPEGITFEPLPAEYASSLIPADDKFALHNLAEWKHGLLVRVPKGVELDGPLYVQVRSTTPGAALFWRMAVIAEEGARFTLIEDLASTAPDLSAYTNAVVELHVEQGAKIEYVSLQNLSRETWHFGRHRARLERDSELDLVLGGFGSKRGKVWVENDLVGPGATSRVTGAYFADGDQHLDYDTFQEHVAPNTESDFAFKGALRERATAVWRGMIRVEPEAQQTNAYQENRNLLLSDQAHADSIPGLEILANDVRCTHGATLGKVNRDELFYLMARGLSRSEAERMIVRGFFQDVLDRIELLPVREALGEALEARIPQA